MYDPEKRLELTSLLERFRSETELMRQAKGKDNPAVKLSNAIDDALEVYSGLKEEYEERFDPDEKQKKLDTLKAFIKDFKEALEKMKIKLQ